MTIITTREATFGNDNDCSHKDENINISDMIIFMKMMMVPTTMTKVMTAEMMRAHGSNSKVEP